MTSCLISNSSGLTHNWSIAEASTITEPILPSNLYHQAILQAQDAPSAGHLGKTKALRQFGMKPAR